MLVCIKLLGIGMHLVKADEALDHKHADISQVTYFQFKVSGREGCKVVLCHLVEELVLIERTLLVGQHEGKVAQTVVLQ